MQMDSGKGLSVLAVSLILSACGGGGGESATPFASWSSVPATSTVVASGLGQQGTYDYDPATKRISNIVPPSSVSGNYSAEMTFDGSVLTGLTLTTPTTSMSFASNEIASLSPQIIGASNFNSNALLANPSSAGWDYQTFGVWETGLDTNQGSFGAMSVGTPTAGSAIPSSGSATFVGSVAGSWVNTTGVGHAVLADLTVNADFANQSLSFLTANTRTSVDWKTFTANDGLTLSGTLKYSPGTNGFSGTLTSTSGLTGNSTGQFYGPSAQELGGVFFLQGNGETYTGAYGAKQTP